MKEPKLSEQLSDDELYAQNLRCPDCERHGTSAGFGRGGDYMGIQVFEGLNLGHCAGCVSVARVRGISPVSPTSLLV